MQGGFRVFAELYASAGEEPEILVGGAGEEDVAPVDADAGDPVVEAVSVAVEGQHGSVSLLETLPNGYNQAP